MIDDYLTMDSLSSTVNVILAHVAEYNDYVYIYI